MCDGAVRLYLFGGVALKRNLLGHTEAIQIEERHDVGQSRVDEEGRRPLATAHGDGLERERFNLFSGDNLLPNVGKIYQLRHNAVDVCNLTVAGFDILICVALPLVVYKGGIDAERYTLALGGVTRNVDVAVGCEPTER